MEVLQTLDDVPLQAAGIGHDLRHGVDTGALQRHAPGHNEADVAAAQDHHIPAGHEALHIHQTLGRTGGINARRAGAGDVQRTTGALPAAHGQNDGLRLNLHEARLPAGDGQHPVRGQVQHHGTRQTGDVQLPELPHILSGVLRAGELPAEGMQTKARMDTLIQNTKNKSENQMKTLAQTILPRIALHKCLSEEGFSEEDVYKYMRKYMLDKVAAKNTLQRLKWN